MRVLRSLSIALTVGAVLVALHTPAVAQLALEDSPPTNFPAAWRHALFIHPVPISCFNRVDGLVQSVAVRGRAPFDFDRPPLFEAFSRLDVQVVELPHYQVRGGVLGLAANLPCSRLGDRSGWWANFSAEYHKETISPDDWLVGRAENTLAALLTKDDYKNYYLAEGYALSAAARYIHQSQKTAFTGQASWRDDLHHPLSVATEWSLLPLQSRFRTNYEAAGGRERRLRFAVQAAIKDAPRLPKRSVQLDAIYETAGGPLGGSFDFDGVFGILLMKAAAVGNNWLTLRVIGGARKGDLANQHVLRLGGIGSLRGMPHQVFTGNRMWMFNAEYRLGGDGIGRLTFCPFSFTPVRQLLTITDLGFLYDVGTAYHVPSDAEVLNGWFRGKARDNWGIFLTFADDLVRIEWATSRFLGDEYSDVLRIRTGWHW